MFSAETKKALRARVAADKQLITDQKAQIKTLQDMVADLQAKLLAAQNDAEAKLKALADSHTDDDYLTALADDINADPPEAATPPAAPKEAPLENQPKKEG